MSTPLNPPNVRYPFTLPSDMHPDVRKAMEFALNGLTVHEQAFAALKSQLNTVATTVQTTSSSSGGSSPTPPIPSITSLGVVNDQIGVTAYTTQQGDNGAKIIVGDAAPIAISLNSGVTIPWFCVIDNDSSSYASLSPTSGSLFGETVIPPAGFGLIFFDGTNFWCGATKIATDSSMGYVQPDGVTIDCDSGIIFTQVTVDSGAPSSMPVTPGNPFYFDSSFTPWHGYVWHGNAWHEFS
jgi:hypothetical protein